LKESRPGGHPAPGRFALRAGDKTTNLINNARIAIDGDPDAKGEVMLGDEELYLATRTEQLVRQSGLTRRQVLKLGAALPVALGIARVAPARAAYGALAAAPPIVKPLPADLFVQLGTNAEMRWDAMKGQGYYVSNDRFFVRDHTATPTIDASAWQLRVFGSGLTGGDVTFTLDQLRNLPSHTATAFVECAGNGRSFFAIQQNTPAPGSQWGLGAIGVARWTGVRLADVLQRAGISTSAVDVMPQGLDQNVVTAGVDYGQVRRPLPVAKALDDALLVYEMNGQQLPADHGFPLRLIVPGWVGVASIKWIGQIEVSAQPLFSLWNTQQYRLIGPAYPADSPPLTTQVVKSAWELTRGAALPYKERVELTGRAWSGTSGISRVDVSIDHGATWNPAKLLNRSQAGNWSRFKYSFPPQPSGSYELWARATDSAGNTQPATVPFNNLGYLFGAIVRHPVVIH
jgi:DMSO/TMAO reductase YedYZ molybdopterin-dependent catalytic subunit